jgi:hypothetical protein
VPAVASKAKNPKSPRCRNRNPPVPSSDRNSTALMPAGRSGRRQIPPQDVC